MDETRIRATVAEVLAGIAPEADLSTVGDDEDLREALDLDSMDFLNFVIGLGAKTGRKIAEVDTRNLVTMRGVLAYLGSG